MLCVKCNRNPAEISISGKLLCKQCARNEIIKRVRRELSETRILSREDKVILAYPDFYEDVAKLIKDIILKICKDCKLDFEEIRIEFKNNEINYDLWKLFTNIMKSNLNKIILPFTADFFLSYMIYSISTFNYGFLSYYGLTNIFNDKILFTPLYNTPLKELKGFNEITGELITNDQLFNGILKWANAEFSDNEIFHTFENSLTIFKSNRCKICGAYTKSAEYCEYCLRSFSH